MLPSRALSLSIDRDWREVYEAAWRPHDFLKWASGLAESALQPAGEEWWRAQGPTGSIRIRFTDHNSFGIMDHYVDLGGGNLVYVPMRIIQNGDGAEVLFTLFRQPGMSDEAFEADAEWVKRDLAALRTLVTS